MRWVNPYRLARVYVYTRRHGCRCPVIWSATTEEGQMSHHPSCPRYTDCGGWRWDPPCGGCDRCIQAQLAYYRNQP